MQGDADVPGNADIPDKTDIPDGTGMQDNAGSADNPAGPEVPADPEGSKDAEQGADMPGGTGGAETPGDPKDPETPADPKDSVTPADPETHTGPEDTKEEYQDTDAANAVDRLRNALLDNKTPAVTGELIRLFLNTRRAPWIQRPRHQYELACSGVGGKTLTGRVTGFVYHCEYFMHDENGTTISVRSYSTKQPAGCFPISNTSTGAAAILGTIKKKACIYPPAGICTDITVTGSKASRVTVKAPLQLPLTDSISMKPIISANRTIQSEKT